MSKITCCYMIFLLDLAFCCRSLSGRWNGLFTKLTNQNNFPTQTYELNQELIFKKMSVLIKDWVSSFMFFAYYDIIFIPVLFPVSFVSWHCFIKKKNNKKSKIFFRDWFLALVFKSKWTTWSNYRICLVLHTNIHN